MKQIRYGVFETNSSSVHTIAIPRDYSNPQNLDVPSHVTIYPEEFGWGFMEYNDLNTKIDYMYQICLAVDNEKKWIGEMLEKPEELSEWALKYYTSLHNMLKNKKSYVDTFLSLLQDFGIENITISKDVESGYIDHGSCWVGEIESFFEEPNLMKSFLFDYRSLLLTGNDNNDDDRDILSDGSYITYTKTN